MTCRSIGPRRRFSADGRTLPVSHMNRLSPSGSSKNRNFCVQSVTSNFLSVSLCLVIWSFTGESLCPPAYLTEGHSGYAERTFAHTCAHCSFVIDRKTLAVAKFVREFVMDPTNTRDIERYGNAVYLPYAHPFFLLVWGSNKPLVVNIKWDPARPFRGD